MKMGYRKPVAEMAEAELVGEGLRLSADMDAISRRLNAINAELARRAHQKESSPTPLTLPTAMVDDIEDEVKDAIEDYKDRKRGLYGPEYPGESF